MSADEKPLGHAANIVKHDIRNQLSNISLAVEQLKYEVPAENEDCGIYLEMVAASCKRINLLLESL